MASSPASKTLIEIFSPSKRLKTLFPSASPGTPIPKSPISALSNFSAIDATQSPSNLTPEQRSRIEINKSLARSKRNLRLCTERIEKSKAEGLNYAKLEELLVEETWLEAIPGELQKPYAKNLCKFVEGEIHGSVPVYPPPYLIFNALHSTPFDRLKAVIIGQGG